MEDNFDACFSEPSERGPGVPPFLEDEKEVAQKTGKEEEEEDDDEDEEEEEEGPTAPIELMGEVCMLWWNLFVCLLNEAMYNVMQNE